MDTKPVVSVLMPVYNGEKYLAEAIESILNQTFTDFEFIIINDGSTDGSLQIAESYARGDRRILLITRDNRGLQATLNEGLDIASGRYVIRMDADDISLPERFAQQYRFMEENPKVIVAGTCLKLFGEGMDGIWTPPAQDSLIRASHLFFSCIYHPTSVLRLDSLNSRGLRYDLSYAHGEDYDFWIRVADHGQLANINQVLLHYRRHPNTIGSTQSELVRPAANRIRKRILSEKLRCDFTEEQFRIHEALCYWEAGFFESQIKPALAWLGFLEKCNIRTGYTTSQAMKMVTNNYRIWLNMVSGSKVRQLWAIFKRRLS